MLRVCCSQSEKSFNLITHQKYFRRVRVKRVGRSTRVSREGRVKGGGEREKPERRADNQPQPFNDGQLFP